MGLSVAQVNLPSISRGWSATASEPAQTDAGAGTLPRPAMA